MFTLKSTIAFFPQILAGAPYVASDPNIFKADACNLTPTAPVYGVGPWFISQYDPDEQMVFEPNPYYTGDLKPQVKQVIVRFFSDPNTMALAVQSGEIDVAWRLFSPDQLTQLKTVSSVKIGTIAGGRIQLLVLNHTIKPFDDPNVDKAIASAIDRNEIADTVYGGQVTPLYSQVPPGFLGATEAFDKMYASPNPRRGQEVPRSLRILGFEPRADPAVVPARALRRFDCGLDAGRSRSSSKPPARCRLHCRPRSGAPMCPR